MSQNSQKLDLLHFPLNGLRLIEASAGTGKTYSIAALYVRLVLGHGRDDQGALVPPEILVLTYTRAATQELRDRIRQRLVEADTAFRTGNDGDDPFIRDLLDDIEPDNHPACAARLQQAAEWMDEAAIHTIHAWCQTMLRQHAFDSGSLFAQDVDSEDRALFEQVVKDYWRRYFYGHELEGCGLQDVASDPASFSRMLRDLLKPGLMPCWQGRRLDGLEPEEAARQLKNRIQSLKNAWTEKKEEVASLLSDAVARKELNSPYNRPADRNEWFRKLDEWCGSDAECPDELKCFRTKCIQEKRSKAAKDRDLQVADHPWFEQVDTWFAPPEVQSVTVHAVAWVRDRYQAEKRRRNRLDFDDLLVNLDQALASENGESLRNRILESFPVALIDEFQDTDPVQYRIFDRVYASALGNERNALIMIGDPKQSIYGFRGADIHTYLAARDKTTAQDRFTLPTNYRSTKTMVEAVNHLFEAGNRNPEGAFGFGDGGNNRVPFEPVTAKGQSEELVVDGACPTPLTFWHQPTEGKYVTSPSYEQTMADQTARHIVDLLNGSRDGSVQSGFRKSEDGTWRPMRPADIAVLVNKGKEAEAVRKALRKRGVGSVYLSDKDSVFGQREAKDVLAILEAAARPMDAGRVRRALATASLCRTLDELDALSRDEDLLEQEIERFRTLGQVWRQHGVLAMLRRLLIETAVAERLKAAGPDWERRLTNLLHLAELLQAESGKRDGAQGLIDWLQTEIARDNDDGSENDSEIIRLESDEGLVQVITVHKSKGLQYGLVFVPFASRYGGSKVGAVKFLEYHDERRQRVAEFDLNDPTAIERSQRAAVQERIRLLYVALTRAQHACWVGVAKVNTYDDSAPSHLLAGLAGKSSTQLNERRVSPTELRNALTHLDENSTHITVQDVHDDAPEIVKLLPEDESFEYTPPLDSPTRPRERWWIASYSSLPRGSGHGVRTAGLSEASEAPGNDRWQEMTDEERSEAERGVPDTARPEDGTIHAFPRGAAPGTLLHDLLEWAGNRGFAEALQDRDALQAEVHRRLKRRRWQDHESMLIDWLARQLAAPIRLGDRSTRLIDLRPERHQYSCELNFLFATHGVDICKIDRRVRNRTVQGRDRPPFDPHTVQGMFTGFIDLVFEHEGRWYVVDYKSNHLGPDATAYTREKMADAILEHRYDMQFVIYELALHRLLKQRMGTAYRPEQHLGGAAYLLLRGCDNTETAGVYFEPADIELIEALDRLFAGQEVRDVA
ncbi:MAG: exodeoxyribonuclease V subunit beta [Wenzhouxiangellaceae bacterium]|nr:exodeoxyribonuclease V subunit beta [Wenzhouxiangellaceae bacterium]